MDYDDLDLSGPLIEGPELAAKVRAAIEAQKNGPLPHWIRAPKPRHKEERHTKMLRGIFIFRKWAED